MSQVSCPSPNAPEWISLVAALGQGDAMAAYNFYNRDRETPDIPTLAEARSVLQNVRTLNSDERHVRSDDAFKLDRTHKQEQMLLGLRELATTTPGQKAAIDKLLANNREYAELLESNIRAAEQGQPGRRTTSVTSFIGSSDYTGKDNFDAFKHFGTYMHNLLEDLQVMGNEEGKSSSQVLTRELFDEHRKNIKKDLKFEVQGLTEDMLFDMVRQMSALLDRDARSRALIIPELTIMSTNVHGAHIVGRLDLMVLDTEGNVTVLDFKTKKTQKLVDASGVVDAFAARTYLAEQAYVIDKIEEGTAVNFQYTSRKVYDTWTLQTKTYENMLLRAGLKVDSSEIIALLYQADEDPGTKVKRFNGFALEIFKGQNFYLGAGIGAKTPAGVKLRLDQMGRRVEDFRKMVDQMLPITEEQALTSDQNLLKQFGFDTTEAQHELMLTTMQQQLDANLTQVRAKLKQYKDKNPALEKIYQARYNTLLGLQSTITRNRGLDSSLKVAFTTQALQSEFKEIYAQSLEALKNYRDSTGKQRILHGEAVRQAHQKMLEITPLFSQLKGLVDNALADPKMPQVTEGSDIVRVYNEMEHLRSQIETAFRETGFENLVSLIQSQIGHKAFTRVSDEYRLALEPKIKLQREKVEKLRQGLPLSLGSKIGYAATAFMDRVKKRQLTRNLDDIAKNNLSVYEQEKQALDEMERIYNHGFSSSREDIEKFVKGVTEPNSLFYIGQSDKFSKGFNFRLDGFIASMSNSDMGVYAIMSMLKQAQNDASQAAMKSLQNQEFDKTMRDLVSDRGEKKANEDITEMRTRQRINKQTNEVEEVTEQYFRIPYSQSYTTYLDTYSTSLRTLRDEIELIRAEAYSHEKGTPEFQAATQQYLQKIEERDRLQDAHEQWQQQYQHRPMVKEFYELSNKLPLEVRREIQGKYLEIEMITRRYDKHSEEEYTDEDLVLLHQLEIEIKKIKKDAIDDNADYKQYLEGMEKFFYFEPNLVAYERARIEKEKRYADNPALLKKWHEENTIYAPTKAWHQELDELYTRMGEIIGTKDQTLGDMFQDRSRIMAPYRRDGEFDPTHLTAEDAEKLRLIDQAINKFKKDTKQVELDLDEDQKAELGVLSAKLKGMSTSVVNRFYQQNMSEKSRLLMARREELLRALGASNLARESKDQDAIEKTRASEAVAMKNFMQEEAQFALWYNQNHKTKYKGTVYKTGISPENGAQPLAFNFVKVPPKELHEQYMEHRPRGQWSIRKERDRADMTRPMDPVSNPLDPTLVNIDYAKHYRLPNGTALPKGLRIDNGVVSVEPGADLTYINPKFLELQQDSKALAFYNQLMPEYFKRQESITGRARGYLVPGGSANLVQLAQHSSLTKAVNNRLKNMLDENFSGKEASEHDLGDNYYGDLGGQVRLANNNQFSQAKQSPDAINNVVKWLAESHYNEALADVQPIAESMVDFLKLQLAEVQGKITDSMPSYQKQAADLANIIKIIETENAKIISGKMSEGGNRKLRKGMSAIFGYTAFARIAFDLANQTKNYMSGSLQAWMAAGGAGESVHYTRSDMGFALTQQLGSQGFFKDYLKDWGKLSGLSLWTQLYRAFNPAQHDYQKYVEDTTGTRGRRMQAKLSDPTELAHAFQEKGDTAIAQMVWMAVMNHYEYNALDAQGQPIVIGTDSEGKPLYQKVKAHDCYALNNKNELVIRGDVDFTKEDERWIREVVHGEVRRAQGNYAAADKTQIETTLAGQIMSFFRKYLIPGVLTRMGHLRPDWEGKQVHYGYLRCVLAAARAYSGVEVMKHMIVGAYAPNWVKGTTVNSFYAKKLAHAGRDLISGMLLTTISMLLLGYVKQKDDDEEEIGFLVGNAIRVIWGVKQETTSMLPLPIVGGLGDYIKNFTSFTTMTKEFTQIIKVLTHMVGTLYAGLVGGWGEEPEDDDFLYELAYQQAYYQRSEGAYEAGDFKLEKDFTDLTGLKNILNTINPNDKLQIDKKLQ